MPKKEVRVTVGVGSGMGLEPPQPPMMADVHVSCFDLAPAFH